MPILPLAPGTFFTTTAGKIAEVFFQKRPDDGARHSISITFGLESDDQFNQLFRKFIDNSADCLGQRTEG